MKGNKTMKRTQQCHPEPQGGTCLFRHAEGIPKFVTLFLCKSCKSRQSKKTQNKPIQSHLTRSVTPDLIRGLDGSIAQKRNRSQNDAGGSNSQTIQKKVVFCFSAGIILGFRSWNWPNVAFLT